MKRLNIFVDESGDFGLENKSSDLYVVSFTFHEQLDNIMNELEKLNNRLNKINYTNMIHMADLIMKRKDYEKMNLNQRKSIFNAIYQFSRKIPIKYHTIIINKKYIDTRRILKKQIFNEILEMIKNNGDYFNKFDKIVMYYDNGQATLGKILDSLFSRFEKFEHIIDFDHKEKRLFQVSDMLTYIDKCAYKYLHKIKFSKSDIYFFGNEEIRKIIKELENKRL